MSSMLKYRPDIDGLRAVAVLSVLIFHLNKQWMPGGFLGVDVFFVISGYLITGIIFSQVCKGNFSFPSFYLRRLRRIYPAAVFVALCSVLVGLRVMLPSDFARLAESALGTLASAANIYFWLSLDTSYFASSSELSPLLHMWSLGVEEQFYLIWPLLLLLSYRLGATRGVVVAGAVIACASFALSAGLTSSHHSFAYYMLPTRASELLVGALAFIVSTRFRWENRRMAAEVASVVSVCALAFLYSTVGDGELYPGFMSAPVAISVAVLIISGGAGTIVSKVLAWRPIVLIGLVSYSLYLWHWPVLAFYRYTYGPIEGAAYPACVVIIVLGTLVSYHLIEKPFRFGDFSFPKRIMAGAAALVLVLIAADGVLRKDSQLYSDIIAADQYDFNCQVSDFSSALLDEDRCLIGATGKPKALLVGDSNAGHLVGFFDVIGKAQGVAIRNATHSGCPPFPDGASDPYVKDNIRESCRRYNNAIWGEIPTYDTIIVGAAWNYYWRLNTKQYIGYLNNLVSRFSGSGQKVVLVLQVPFFGNYDRLCYQKAQLVEGIDCVARGTNTSSKETKINSDLSTFASRHPNVEVVTLRSALCGEDTCSAYLGGIPMYYDTGHLSMQGSQELGRYFLRTAKAPRLTL